jgi:hypothetical protein
MPLGSKLAHPGDHLVYIDLYRKQILLVLNYKEPIDICYEAFCSRHIINKYFKNYAAQRNK